MRVRLYCILLCTLLAPLKAQVETPSYRNPKLPIEDRVSDLLSRMTLEEKVEQISGGRRKNVGIVDPTGQFTQEKLDEVFKGLWDINSHMSPHDRAVLHNGLQRYQLEKTRLGIPAIFQGEALHGFMAYRSTSFPQALGLASTWRATPVGAVRRKLTGKILISRRESAWLRSRECRGPHFSSTGTMS